MTRILKYFGSQMDSNSKLIFGLGGCGVYSFPEIGPSPRESCIPDVARSSVHPPATRCGRSSSVRPKLQDRSSPLALASYPRLRSHRSLNGARSRFRSPSASVFRPQGTVLASFRSRGPVPVRPVSQRGVVRGLKSCPCRRVSQIGLPPPNPRAHGCNPPSFGPEPASHHCAPPSSRRRVPSPQGGSSPAGGPVPTRLPAPRRVARTHSLARWPKVYRATWLATSTMRLI